MFLQMPEMKNVIIALVWLVLQLFCILTTCQYISDKCDYKTESFELPNYVVLEGYDMELDLRTIENGFFSGTSNIRIKIRGHPYTPRNISFHVLPQRVQISSIVLYDIYRPDILYVADSCTYYVKSNVMDVYFRFIQILNPLYWGTYNLRISFTTTLPNDEEDDFFLKTLYKDKEKRES